MAGSVASPQMPDRELNLSVGALPPIFNDWNETALWNLSYNFAGFATSFLNWQLEYLRRLHDGYPGCQILRANAHVRPPEVRERGLVPIVPILGVGA